MLFAQSAGDGGAAVKLLRAWLVGFVSIPLFFAVLCFAVPLYVVDNDAAERILNWFDDAVKRLAGRQP
jgi:hypothetical protein